MPLHDDEPLEDLLARSRDGAQQFDVTDCHLACKRLTPALPYNRGGER